MEHSLGESPFFLAYAHEALARAAALNGDPNGCAHHLTEARKLAPRVSDLEERGKLTIRTQPLQSAPELRPKQARRAEA